MKLLFRSSKEYYTSPKNPSEEWLNPRRSLQGENSETTSKGKTSQEVQNLIEKQKKHLEDFDKKKDYASKNFVLGMMDTYGGNNKLTYHEIRQDKTERELQKNIYENHEGF